MKTLLRVSRAGVCRRRTGPCRCEQSLPRMRGNDSNPLYSHRHFVLGATIPRMDDHRVAGPLVGSSLVIHLLPLFHVTSSSSLGHLCRQVGFKQAHIRNGSMVILRPESVQLAFWL